MLRKGLLFDYFRQMVLPRDFHLVDREHVTDGLLEVCVSLENRV